MNKYALVFSGQGSERVGMFRELLKESNKLNQVLKLFKEQLNIDLEEAINTKDAEVVAKNNQLLLCIYHHLVSDLVVEKVGFAPTFCMGHSFGQFMALASSRAVEFMDVGRFVKRRIDIINDPNIEVKASFKSIHGLTKENVEQLITSEGLAKEVELALHNQKEQVVCAATKHGADRLEVLSEKYKYMIKEVNVSRPYHTSFMEEYNQILLPHIEEMEFSDPWIPVVTNYSKKGISDKVMLKEETKMQMVKPVFWVDSVMEVAKEVDSFVIIDPSDTQFKILRRITNKKIHNVNNMGIVKMIEKRGL